jgi:hypothetical protein
MEGKVRWQRGGHAPLALCFGANLVAGESALDQPLIPDVHGFTSMVQPTL